jgi:hypothetical protein
MKELECMRKITKMTFMTNVSKIRVETTYQGIKIIYNYLPKFERIRVGDSEKPLMGPT